MRGSSDEQMYTYTQCTINHELYVIVLTWRYNYSQGHGIAIVLLYEHTHTHTYLINETKTMEFRTNPAAMMKVSTTRLSRMIVSLSLAIT